MLAEGKDVADVCRQLQIAEQMYYRWGNQFSGLKAADAKLPRDWTSPVTEQVPKSSSIVAYPAPVRPGRKL
jgi:hypothetical protein